MKKMAVVIMMALIAALCCFATTHTIVLISTVEKTDAQYVIRNNETGAMGASVIYSTSAISRQNVSTSFSIIQSNNSNSRSTVNFAISATELVARENGKVYSTEGISIKMDGVSYGSSFSFNRVMDRAYAAGTEVGSFEVEWNTNANLIDATYEACITLVATAL